jgi:hypothetical protein
MGSTKSVVAARPGPRSPTVIVAVTTSLKAS